MLRLFDAKFTLFSKINHHILAALLATENLEFFDISSFWRSVVLGSMIPRFCYDGRPLNDMNKIVLRANIIFLRIL